MYDDDYEDNGPSDSEIEDMEIERQIQAFEDMEIERQIDDSYEDQ